MLQMQGIAREIALDIVARRRRAAAGAGQLGPRARPRRRTRWSFGPRSSTPPSAGGTSGSCSAPSSGPRSPRREATLLARTLQQTLIPPAPPNIPGLDVAAALPAGGHRRGGRRRLLRRLRDRDPATGWSAVGDVSGKGVDAAVVTALARYTIRAAAVRDPRPRDDPRRPSTRYCSATRPTGSAPSPSCASATATAPGPPPRASVATRLPLLLRAGAEPVALGRARIAGRRLRDRRLPRHEIRLRPGDTIVLFTDGVTEGRRGRDFFGERRLDAHGDRTADLDLRPGRSDPRGRAAVPGRRARDDIVLVSARVPPGSPAA